MRRRGCVPVGFTVSSSFIYSNSGISMMAVKILPSRETHAECPAKIQQAPVAEILRTEFSVLGTSSEHQRRICERYDNYVQSIVECVKSEWPEGISKVPERELFTFLADVFHSNFKASYSGEKLLSTSVLSNEFNCYSASVLMSDVLARLGKRVSVAITPGHVLLKGDKCVFETTREPGDAVFLNRYLDFRYPFHHEGGMDFLLAVAYGWCATTLIDMSRYEEALELAARSIALNPDDADFWCNHGIALDGLGRRDEAFSSLDRALSLNPKLVEAWNNKGIILDSIGRHEEAMACYDWALKLKPKDADAWNNKGGSLEELGRHEESLACYNKALKLDPEYLDAWNNKGALLEKMGKERQAKKCFKMAEKLERQKK